MSIDFQYANDFQRIDTLFQKMEGIKYNPSKELLIDFKEYLRLFQITRFDRGASYNTWYGNEVDEKNLGKKELKYFEETVKNLEDFIDGRRKIEKISIGILGNWNKFFPYFTKGKGEFSKTRTSQSKMKNFGKYSILGLIGLGTLFGGGKYIKENHPDLIPSSPLTSQNEIQSQGTTIHIDHLTIYIDNREINSSQIENVNIINQNGEIMFNTHDGNFTLNGNSLENPLFSGEGNYSMDVNLSPNHSNEGNLTVRNNDTNESAIFHVLENDSTDTTSNELNMTVEENPTVVLPDSDETITTDNNGSIPRLPMYPNGNGSETNGTTDRNNRSDNSDVNDTTETNHSRIIPENFVEEIDHGNLSYNFHDSNISSVEEILRLVDSSIDYYVGKTFLKNQDREFLSLLITTIFLLETKFGTDGNYLNFRGRPKEDTREVLYIQVIPDTLTTILPIVENKISESNLTVEKIKKSGENQVRYGTYIILEYFEYNYNSIYLKNYMSQVARELEILKLLLVDYNGGNGRRKNPDGTYQKGHVDRYMESSQSLEVLLPGTKEYVERGIRIFNRLKDQ